MTQQADLEELRRTIHGAIVNLTDQHPELDLPDWFAASLTKRIYGQTRGWLRRLDARQLLHNTPTSPLP